MAFPGPTPPYNNLPIQPENYKPRRFVISAISLGQSTTITTSTDNDYVIGQQVRLIIPFDCKAVQLNEKTGFVTSKPAANQVIVDIDSSQNVDSFVYAVYNEYPQILAIGDNNFGFSNPSGRLLNNTTIDGAFINISS